MIPKSSRFKCCHCGYLKKRPGKCVWCGKLADFDNLMEVAWQSAGTVTSLPGELQTANTQRLHRQRSPVAINSNFPVPALSNASLLDNVKRKQKPQGPGKAKLLVRYEESGRRFKIAASANFHRISPARTGYMSASCERHVAGQRKPEIRTGSGEHFMGAWCNGSTASPRRMTCGVGNQTASGSLILPALM